MSEKAAKNSAIYKAVALLVAKESREHVLLVCNVVLTISAIVFPWWTYSLMKADILERNRPTIGIDNFQFQIQRKAPHFIGYSFQGKNYGTLPAKRLWLYTRLKLMDRQKNGNVLFYKTPWAEVLISHASIMPGQEFKQFHTLKGVIYGNEPIDVRALNSVGLVHKSTSNPLYFGFLNLTEEAMRAVPHERNSYDMKNFENPPAPRPEDIYGLEVHWRYLSPGSDRSYSGEVTFDVPDSDKFSKDHPIVGSYIE